MAERKINPSQANRDAARGLRRMKMITDIVAHQNECSLQIYSSIVKVQNDTKNNHIPIKKKKKHTQMSLTTYVKNYFPHILKKMFESVSFMKFYPKIKLSRVSESKYLLSFLLISQLLLSLEVSQKNRFWLANEHFESKISFLESKTKKCSQCCEFSLFPSNF